MHASFKEVRHIDVLRRTRTCGAFRLGLTLTFALHFRAVWNFGREYTNRARFSFKPELDIFGISAMLPTVMRVDYIVPVIFLASPNVVFVRGMTWSALLRFSFKYVV